MNRRFAVSLAVAPFVMTAFAPSAHAAPPAERYELGRDAPGDPCVATVRWSTGKDGVRMIAEQPYTIACRGVSAARVQGIIAPVAAIDTDVSGRTCGAATAVRMQGVTGASARICSDASLGFDVVEIRFVHNGRAFNGAAAKSALGPLEVAMRAIAGITTPTAVAANGEIAAAPVSVEIASLEAAPAASASPATSGTSDVDSALQQGVSLILRGLHADASRVLNDALSRVTPDTRPAVRIDLSLSAALADSNIGQREAADGHFANAAAVLAANPDLPRAAFLLRKRSTYQALDLVNRRRFRDAIAALDLVPKSASPLSDPVELGRLNQYDASKSNVRTVSVADTEALSWLVIEATRSWVRSQALLGTGKVAESQGALQTAANSVSQLQRNVSPASVGWLRSGIQRQAGRIAERKGDIAAALAHYDCAIATLQGFVRDASSRCLMSDTITKAVSYTPATGPVVAQTQLERAAVLARAPGSDPAVVLREYRAAVDTLALASSTGEAPTGMESYLDLLLKSTGGTADTQLAEEYFRALQTIGEPAIAKDVARLQDVVTNEGSVGAKIRDRADLAQQVTAKRFEINSLPAGDARIARLEGERTALERRLQTLDAEVGPAGGGALYTQQATVEAVRAALKPGEVYLKISAARARLYGIVISADKTFVYRLRLDGPVLKKVIVDPVLASSRTYTDPATGKLRIRPFEVEKAYALFRTITGPAEAEVAAAKAIVFDPAGPLRSVPMGTLVASIDSVKAYKALPKEAVQDYSGVAFVSRRADLSTALSPSSFLIVRNKVSASSAPKPFIGIGENALALAVSSELGVRPVLRGAGCTIGYQRWRETLNATKPISAREIGIAATALGVGSPATITGAAFNDVALQADSDAGQLAQYQVVHFATHGLPEQIFTADGCPATVPSALVTTMASPDNAGGQVSDGLLSFAEVGRLRFDANLVVLSACETAAGTSQTTGRLAGQESSSASLDGLVRAFISANARAVLATFWSVPASEETDELIGEFYRTGRSASIGSALRSAQARLIAQPKYSHPYYWGAYFVVGDSTKTMLSGTAVAAR
jgi:CHAT domain-containing protein